MLFGRYAGRRSESRYPTLWDGLIGAWCPSVQNPSGVTLFDLSGYSRNGTLTNMDAPTDWVYSNGLRCLDFDGTNDYAAVNMSFTGSSATFSCWINLRATTTYRALGLFGRTPVAFTPVIGMQTGSGGNRVGYTWNNNSSATYNWTGGPIIPTNEWVLVAVTISPSQAIAYMGSPSRPITSGTNAISHSSETVTSGWRIAGDTFNDTSTNCQLDDIRIYNRALTPGEIRQLATGRGIAYQPRRTVNYGSTTTLNRRRTSMFLTAG